MLMIHFNIDGRVGVSSQQFSRLSTHHTGCKSTTSPATAGVPCVVPMVLGWARHGACAPHGWHPPSGVCMAWQGCMLTHGAHFWKKKEKKKKGAGQRGEQGPAAGR